MTERRSPAGAFLLNTCCAEGQRSGDNARVFAGRKAWPCLEKADCGTMWQHRDLFVRGLASAAPKVLAVQNGKGGLAWHNEPRF